MTTEAKDVIEVLANELGVATDGISLKLRLADIGVDSIDQLGLAIRLEEAFGIAICDVAVAGLRTVGDVAHMVEGSSARRELGR